MINIKKIFSDTLNFFQKTDISFDDVKKLITSKINLSKAETVKVDKLNSIAREFMASVFELNLNECIVTDESLISDFSHYNITDLYDVSIKDLIKLGDDFTIHIIDETYMIKAKINDKLVDIFEKINERYESDCKLNF